MKIQTPSRRLIRGFTHRCRLQSLTHDSPSLGRVAEELATTRGVAAQTEHGRYTSRQTPSPKPRSSASTLPKESEERCVHTNGFTLVELLIALGIASVLALVALPTVRETIKANNATRSAEMVRSVFVNARSQAIQSQRPVGVAMQRAVDSGENANFCQRLSFVASPPAYTGDVTEAVAYLQGRGISDSGVPGALLRFGFSQEQCPRLFSEVQVYNAGVDNVSEQRTLALRPGAKLWIGDAIGPLRITGVSTGQVNTGNGRVVAGTNVVAQWDWPNVTGDLNVFPTPTEINQMSNMGVVQQYNFRIEGLPQPSFLPAVELPRGATVDLSLSGVGLDGVQFNSQAIRCSSPFGDSASPNNESGFDRIVIMFGPSGDVERVFSETWVARGNASAYDLIGETVVGTIYLSIGQAEGLIGLEQVAEFDNTDDWDGMLPNFANPEAAWVTIKTSGGTIDVNPVAAPIEPLSDFNALTGLGVPATGTDCSARAEQFAVLRFRAAHSRRLAKRGAQL